MLQITAISDTHTYLPELPGGDLLIHAGDFTWRGRPEETRLTLDYFQEQLKIYDYVVFIAGNHECTFERRSERDPLLKDRLSERIIYLQEEAVTVKGYKIYGAPHTPAFGSGWAFNVPRGELFYHWDRIHDDTDILVTHSPPYGYGDTVESVEWRYTRDMSEIKNVYRENVGCQELLEALRRVKPQLHIFGHIHEGAGVFKGTGNLDGVILANASSVDVHYKLVHKPLTFELDAPKAIA